jgi:L-glyceraldehyde 3-phosphate reductase
MEYRILGHSGQRVSAFSLGTWKTFEFMAESDALSVIKAAVDAGIDFLDDARYDDVTGTAPFATGYSEVVFGNLLRAGGFDRDKLFVSNRLWFEFYPEETLEAEVDGSLSRIGIDHFDLVFCFLPPENLEANVLVEQLAALIDTGKVRYWASANWSTEFLAECCEAARRIGAPLPTAAMVPYSLSIKSFVENDTIGPLCREYGIGLVASFALQGGILTGKYNAPHAAVRGRYDAEEIEKLRANGTLDRVATVLEIATEIGCSPAQLAYAYCLRHPLVASVLFGATSTAQVAENVASLDVARRLDDELLARLGSIFPAESSFHAG